MQKLCSVNRRGVFVAQLCLRLTRTASATKRGEMSKQKLLCVYKAFYQCPNNTAKLQFLHQHKSMLQNYKINFVNVLALYAGIFVKTFSTLFSTNEG